MLRIDAIDYGFCFAAECVVRGDLRIDARFIRRAQLEINVLFFQLCVETDQNLRNGVCVEMAAFLFAGIGRPSNRYSVR